jgi:hypothetical protein
MRKKVSLIGSAPSKKDAPFDNPDFDIWAISGAVYSESLGETKKPDTPENGWNCIHRIDRLFEMHKPSIFQDKVELFNKRCIPVFMQRRYPEIRSSVAYPIEDVAADVGDDFTSSISYMLALAIHRGYEEIHLNGILLRHDSEYAYQRPSVKEWKGFARGRGIKVVCDPESLLDGAQWRYGYDDFDRVKGIMYKRRETLKKSVSDQRDKIESETASLRQAEGALLLIDRLTEDFEEPWK